MEFTFPNYYKEFSCIVTMFHPFINSRKHGVQAPPLVRGRFPRLYPEMKSKRNGREHKSQYHLQCYCKHTTIIFLIETVYDIRVLFLFKDKHIKLRHVGKFLTNLLVHDLQAIKEVDRHVFYDTMLL